MPPTLYTSCVWTHQQHKTAATGDHTFQILVSGSVLATDQAATTTLHNLSCGLQSSKGPYPRVVLFNGEVPATKHIALSTEDDPDGSCIYVYRYVSVWYTYKGGMYVCIHIPLIYIYVYMYIYFSYICTTYMHNIITFIGWMHILCSIYIFS